MFLHTLGYTSDKVITTALSTASFEDRRGRPSGYKKFSTNEEAYVNDHILSYEPGVSHYRRPHAPYRLYLDPSLSIIDLYRDYASKCEKTNVRKVSESKYKKCIKEMNISFAKLGHEACESCTKNELHLAENNCAPDCEPCEKFEEHKRKYVSARKQYTIDKDSVDTEIDSVILCAGMQKVTMLPEIPGIKSAVFTGRICAYNETFSPVKNNKAMKSISTVWHAGVMGRDDEDVTSAFVTLLCSPQLRDKQHCII